MRSTPRATTCAWPPGGWSSSQAVQPGRWHGGGCRPVGGQVQPRAVELDPPWPVVTQHQHAAGQEQREPAAPVVGHAGGGCQAVVVEGQYTEQAELGRRRLEQGQAASQHGDGGVHRAGVGRPAGRAVQLVPAVHRLEHPGCQRGQQPLRQRLAQRTAGHQAQALSVQVEGQQRVQRGHGLALVQAGQADVAAQPGPGAGVDGRQRGVHVPCRWRAAPTAAA
jgi:hypothetical protein